LACATVPSIFKPVVKRTFRRKVVRLGLAVTAVLAILCLNLGKRLYIVSVTALIEIDTDDK